MDLSKRATAESGLRLSRRIRVRGRKLAFSEQRAGAEKSHALPIVAVRHSANFQDEGGKLSFPYLARALKLPGLFQCDAPRKADAR
jgi:hypothetical protein